EIRQAVYNRFKIADTAILLRLGYNVIKTPFRKDPKDKSLDLFMSVAKLKERRENIMRLYNHEPFHHYKNYASQYAYDKEVLSQRELTELTKHKFENLEVAIPKHYDKILTRMYGDYMELPPEKNRVAKHIDVVIIDGKHVE
ncbi:LicD family protein, partial [Pediococcus acidilactici]|nr:LicD family protein [Pediococcus acidilactici]